MFRRFVHKLILCWMTATTAHFPIPVCDGDNIGSGPLWAGEPCPGDSDGTLIDIDFVLLGCDKPDDPDDGPFDNDPEQGHVKLGIFPVYLRSRTVANPMRMGSRSNFGHQLDAKPNARLDPLEFAERSQCKPGTELFDSGIHQERTAVMLC